MSQELVSAELAKVTDQELTLHLENLGLMKDLTTGERNTYLQICKAFNLNPFKREVHVSKYGGQMAIITGYETYIKRAERTGQLDGWEVKTEGVAKDNSLKAIITIWRKDRSKPFTWEVNYSEYVQMKDGKPNKFWQKAETMIKKVAMSQGFRLCFNDELGGMPYTREEMDTQTEDVTPVTIETKPVKWEATTEMFDKANALISGSALDENGRIQATNSLSNAKTQAGWDKIVNRLLELQTVQA